MTQTLTPPKELKTALPAQEAESQSNGNGNAKRRRVMIVATLLLLAGLAWGVHHIISTWNVESTDDAFIEARVVPISSRVAGHVTEVKVDDNQEVKAGDVLVQIDPRDFEAKVRQAEARLKAAEAQRDLVAVTSKAAVAAAEAGVKSAQAAQESAKLQIQTAQAKQTAAEAVVTSAQAVIQEAKAQVARAEADVTRADTELARVQKMSESSSASPFELTNAQAGAKAAAAALLAAQKRVLSAEAQAAEAAAGRATAAEAVKQAQSAYVESQGREAEAQARLQSAGVAPQQVATAEADVEQAKASLQQAKLDLSYTTITAPQAGRVGRKSVEVGAYVQGGQALMALTCGQPWVIANFKETQLKNMHPGQDVAIRVDAFPRLAITGTVDSLQPGTGSRFSLLPPENATGNFVKVVQRVPVKIVITSLPEGAARKLAPGMSVVPEVKVK